MKLSVIHSHMKCLPHLCSIILTAVARKNWAQCLFSCTTTSVECSGASTAGAAGISTDAD